MLLTHEQRFSRLNERNKVALTKAINILLPSLLNQIDSAEYRKQMRARSEIVAELKTRGVDLEGTGIRSEEMSAVAMKLLRDIIVYELRIYKPKRNPDRPKLNETDIKICERLFDRWREYVDVQLYQKDIDPDLLVSRKIDLIKMFVTSNALHSTKLESEAYSKSGGYLPITERVINTVTLHLINYITSWKYSEYRQRVEVGEINVN